MPRLESVSLFCCFRAWAIASVQAQSKPENLVWAVDPHPGPTILTISLSLASVKSSCLCLGLGPPSDVRMQGFQRKGMHAP